MASNTTLMVGQDGCVQDPRTGEKYLKGRFLGKGGFAKCYSFTRMGTNEVFAGKVVPKALLKKQHQKEKMGLEVEIQRSLTHQNVVKFFSFFEDDANCYVVLELCTNKSLMELHRRRKTITEPECRYYIHQICDGVKYLHGRNIIHRDLKLGNLFLSSDMIVKIGDFGLACRLSHSGERKKTLCGTPNYIAPEILLKVGHSFEVDIWSIGCIMYTFLVGHPPFETKTLNETYDRIKRNKYHIPKDLGSHASKLITSILQSRPEVRPNIEAMMCSEFLQGFTPAVLPVSCLTMAPRSDVLQQQVRLSARRPFGDHNPSAVSKGSPLLAVGASKSNNQPVEQVPSNGLGSLGPTPSTYQLKNSKENLKELQSKLSMVIAKYPQQKLELEEDFETPSSAPMIWISKWVDYSDKYGLGYQLSNDTLAVSFNDGTRLTILPNQKDLLYVNKVNHELYFQTEAPPKELAKKIQLLNYFRDYMNENLLKMGEQHAQQAEDLSRVPVMQNWFRTRTAIVMFLSNGTFQLNFFQDHTKLIMCPFLSAVTFVDERKNFRTYLFDTLIKHGATNLLKEKLTYANSMVSKMMDESELRRARQDAVAKRHPHAGNSQKPNKAVTPSKPVPFR